MIIKTGDILRKQEHRNKEKRESWPQFAHVGWCGPSYRQRDQTLTDWKRPWKDGDIPHPSVDGAAHGLDIAIPINSPTNCKHYHNHFNMIVIYYLDMEVNNNSNCLLFSVRLSYRKKAWL